MKIAVFYGGKSCEHSVSVVTGVSACSLLELEGEEVYPIYIDFDGRWWWVKNYSAINSYDDIKKLKVKPVHIVAGQKFLIIGRKKVTIDCAVLCLHGAYGEDGCIQGALSLSFIPHTGSGVLGSAVGMDKVYSKTAFAQSGLPVVEHFVTDKAQFKIDGETALRNAKKLGYPLVVKPRNLGSSIGVSVANNPDEFILALQTVFEWDNCALIEKKVENLVEYNCAVIGKMGNYEASEIEKPFALDEILSFADKYERGGFKGVGGRQFPAKLSKALKTKIQNYAIEASQSVTAEGIVRVDFLYDGEKLFINEINTIPGSLALYLFPNYRYLDKTGESAVISKLIDLAISREEGKNLLRYRHLDNINSGEKILPR
ncbi:MAG: D-alanine--D-alanine ligase [Clostridia bacterium]|nr:D-alanine--D-alanine ligase [Clostridia bacterium]